MKFNFSNRMFNTRKIALGAVSMTAMALSGGLCGEAVAQAAATPGADAGTSAGDIVVTARRRDESIVDVPLAISVVTDAKIQQLGITSTRDLANFVPGLQFSDFTPGNSRNDRGGNRPLIFRGLSLANNGGVTGAGSMYLDGAAVIGNEIPASMDIGAVEVLRGPQSVYFGRAAMTGAVSYRTKAIPEEWGGQFAATVAERDTHRYEGSVAGHIVPEVLGVRVTGLVESNDGYITNGYNNGAEKLGARSRESISGTVDFTPGDKLEVKLYANKFRDDDGMAATVNIFPALDVANCILPGATRRMICGEVPGPSKAINYSRLDIPAQHANYLFSVPFLKDADFKRQPGMQREALNTHGVINYQLSDYLKFQSITGYHDNSVEQVGDGVQQPVQPGRSLYAEYYYNLANKFDDLSQEFRLSSDPDQAFSWTIGANYVRARNQSTAVVTYLSNNVPSFVNGNTTTAGVFLPLPQSLGDDRAKTTGIFAGAYLKLLEDKLTLSAEGRKQRDTRNTITKSGVTGAVLSNLEDDFDSFSPRVSVDYDVGNKRKLYTSYAEGSRPGGFNAGLLVYYDPTNPIYARAVNPLNVSTVGASITATFGVTDPTYKEETLKISEFGFKGEVFDGKGYFDINTYYGKVEDQQLRKSLVVPALGFSLGAVTNTGETKIYGVEWEGTYNFTSKLSLATTFAWNHTNREVYIDPSAGTVAQFGYSDFSGKELPNTPEYTGSAVLSYEDKLSADWDWFANGAFVYRGKQWADLGNTAYISGRGTLDLRGGISNETFKIEVFGTNLFDDDTYPGGNVAPDFGGNPDYSGNNGQYYGFFGAYAEPRTFGARFSADF